MICNQALIESISGQSRGHLFLQARDDVFWSNEVGHFYLQ